MLYKYRAIVIRVIDGDTIDVDIDLGFFTVIHKQRIRLHGIDAPEVRGSERFSGLKSKSWLKQKIEGKEIELVTFKDAKGKYGRWLGVIYFKNRNINHLMVEKGLAESSR
jgi:micrococcal nuclease